MVIVAVALPLFFVGACAIAIWCMCASRSQVVVDSGPSYVTAAPVYRSPSYYDGSYNRMFPWFNFGRASYCSSPPVYSRSCGGPPPVHTRPSASAPAPYVRPSAPPSSHYSGHQQVVMR